MRFWHDPADGQVVNNELCGDFTPEQFLRTKFTTGAMMPISAWLIPREVARAAGPWDERLTRDDDGEYFTRVVLAAREIRFCGFACSYYRMSGPLSLSRVNTEQALNSEFLSLNLAVDHLLKRDDTACMREAAATALLRWTFEVYPACGLLREQSLQRVESLGGATLSPGRGPIFAIVAFFFGWKAAKRLRVRFGQVNPWYLLSSFLASARMGAPIVFRKNDADRWRSGLYYNGLRKAGGRLFP